MPIARFKQDRQRAREAQDPTANLCVVATVDAEHQPHLRTLILRDIGEELAIFVNATSPKWRQFGGGLSILAFWPSVQVQYRLRATTRPVPEEIVADSWQLRPEAPKRMDWYYERIGRQSSIVGTRADLLANLAELDVCEPLTAPASARGLFLDPFTIERLDLTQNNGIHDRVRYELKDGVWSVTTLVP